MTTTLSSNTLNFNALFPGQRGTLVGAGSGNYSGFTEARVDKLASRHYQEQSRLKLPLLVAVLGLSDISFNWN